MQRFETDPQSKVWHLNAVICLEQSRVMSGMMDPMDVIGMKISVKPLKLDVTLMAKDPQRRSAAHVAEEHTVTSWILCGHSCKGGEWWMWEIHALMRV